MNKSMKLIIILVILLGLVFLGSTSVSGRIMDYLNINLDNDANDEIVLIYKNMYDKSIHLSIKDFINGKYKTTYDLKMDSNYSYYSLAKINNKNYYTILLFNNNRIDYITYNNTGSSLKKSYMNHSSLLARKYKENFPRISDNIIDIDQDGIDEILLFEKNGIHIYKNTKLLQSLSYDMEAMYNYKLAVGGYNVTNTIMLVFPSIISKDLNNDGSNDLIFIYRDSIQYYLYNSKSNKFGKKRQIDLSKYIELRAGYSPFNKHIQFKDFDGNGTYDILIMNFNMATVLNTDKQGVLCYLFKGNRDGTFNQSPSKQMYIEDYSGLESVFIFKDMNNDGRLDLVNIGTKLFSSSFIFSLTVKRSINVEVNIHLQKIDNSFNDKSSLDIKNNISLDNNNIRNSHQTSFDSWSTMDFSKVLKEVIANLDYDINDDDKDDIIIYNFDGSYSLYLSNLKTRFSYSNKPDRKVMVSSKLREIYYQSGPYVMVVNTNEGKKLISIDISNGKLYYKDI